LTLTPENIPFISSPGQNDASGAVGKGILMIVLTITELEHEGNAIGWIGRRSRLR
jgi:hypothetical protein